MEKPCIKCSDETKASCCGCPEWKQWKIECLNTSIKQKRTNFDILNEFVKKTFGFDLDKDTLNHECIIGAQYDCRKRWGGPTCEGCEYKDFWSLEYKERKEK